MGYGLWSEQYRGTSLFMEGRSPKSKNGGEILERLGGGFGLILGFDSYMMAMASSIFSNLQTFLIKELMLLFSSEMSSRSVTL